MKEITDIKEIQQRSLAILKHIDSICKQHNIKYFLAGGTLLGAARHKGFIPWDDDIDILMSREDYERFLQIMDTTPSNKFKCLHYGKDFPNYFYRFAKVCDLETSLQEGVFIKNDNLGIFVDVFPADGIDPLKANKLIKKSHYYASMLMVASSKKYTKSPHGFLRSIVKFFGYFYAKIFGWKYWLKKHENFVKQFKCSDFSHSTLYSGAWGEKEIFPTSYMSDIIYLEFEGQKFPAFKEYDKHLTHLYGNYMQLPPKEKQVTHHDFKIYKKD